MQPLCSYQDSWHAVQVFFQLRVHVLEAPLALIQRVFLELPGAVSNCR